MSAWLSERWFRKLMLPSRFKNGDIVAADLPLPTKDLLYIPLVAAVLLALRHCIERTIALPLAKRYGICDGSKRKTIKRNPVLESYFSNNRSPSTKETEGLAKRVDMSPNAVKTWFRRKRNLSRTTLQSKFCEACWRFTFYSFLFVFGISTLWKTPWFWDHMKCWEYFFTQKNSAAVFWYYMLEAGLYLSLLYTAMTDVKRKDYYEMISHHVVTLFLICFSYVVNFVRIGTLVMIVHDVSDIFLEGAKCFFYLKWKKMADVGFLLFAVVFNVARLVVFPFWIIHTSLIKPLVKVEPYFGYYFFNILLILLQFLNIGWSYIIFKKLFVLLRSKDSSNINDSRSDEEELSDED